MKKITRPIRKIQIDFTDDAITASGGSLFIAEMARRLGLPSLLESALCLKKRKRGAPDAAMLLSLVYSLAQGDGALCDVDRLAADGARREALHLPSVPDSRRLGEYLYRFDTASVAALHGVVRALSRAVAGAVINHELKTKGYVPLFIDGTVIEMSGSYGEGVAKGYDGQPQLWLHNAFIGGLWVSHRLNGGGTGVSAGTAEQVETDVAPLLSDVANVWARMDNAYYRKECVEPIAARGWDYSVSVTHGVYKKPLREEVSCLAADAWTKISATEETAVIYHQPHGWSREQSYVVVRTWWDGAQRLAIPRDSYILVSRTDLPLKEIVARHRGKCGQENAMKGPLIDLDLHHPPCLKLEANRAFYAVGQMAQMLLVAAQYTLLPTSARAHGIRMVIRDLVRVAGKLVRTGRGLIMKFAKNAFRFDWLIYAADRLAENTA